MKQVETVTGPIDVKDLGFTLMHEHVMASGAGIPENYPQLYRPDWFEQLVKDLESVKANGVSTIVDASPYDLGRDPKRLKMVSEASGVNIICNTGFFFGFPEHLGKWSDEEIAQLQIDEVTKGIGETGIKAGLIKAMMDADGPTPMRRQMHHAAAIASMETGVPVFVHSNPLFETGRYQVKFLKEMGLPAHMIKVDHILETSNMEYAEWLYNEGVWIGVERIPRVVTPSDGLANNVEARLRMAKNMIDAGMADRMMFSHDFSGVTPVFDRLSKEEREEFDKQIPGRWNYLQDVFFAELVKRGVDPDVLHTTNVDNPRKFFEEAAPVK